MVYVATWNGQEVARSEKTVEIEGNVYFPKNTLNMEFFKASDTHTTCPWKGEASYYTIVVNGQENMDAAWYYPEPSEAAKPITDHVAFWKGVVVSEE